MANDIYKKAAEARVMYQNEEGFLGCDVVSTSPPVLAFTFDNDQNAFAFQGRMELISAIGMWVIDDQRPNTVLRRGD
jgi:hypothetical protein